MRRIVYVRTTVVVLRTYVQDQASDAHVTKWRREKRQNTTRRERPTCWHGVFCFTVCLLSQCNSIRMLHSCRHSLLPAPLSMVVGPATAAVANGKWQHFYPGLIYLDPGDNIIRTLGSKCSTRKLEGLSKIRRYAFLPLRSFASKRQ